MPKLFYEDFTTNIQYFLYGSIHSKRIFAPMSASGCFLNQRNNPPPIYRPAIRFPISVFFPALVTRGL